MKQILLKLRSFTGNCMKQEIYGFPEGTKFVKVPGETNKVYDYYTIVPIERKWKDGWTCTRYETLSPFKLATHRLVNIIPEDSIDQYVVSAKEMISQYNLEGRVLLNIGQTASGNLHVSCVAKITRVDDIRDVRAVLFWIPDADSRKTYTTYVDSLDLTSLPGSARTYKAQWMLSNKTRGKILWSKISKWMQALQEDENIPCPVPLDLDLKSIYDEYESDTSLLNDTDFLERLIKARLNFIRLFGIRPKDLHV